VCLAVAITHALRLLYLYGLRQAAAVWALCRPSQVLRLWVSSSCESRVSVFTVLRQVRDPGSPA
jgi:hypothetical protein